MGLSPRLIFANSLSFCPKSKDENSCSKLITLPAIHRDPFDRILICQALQHNLTIATVDKNIRNYSSVDLI